MENSKIIKFELYAQARVANGEVAENQPPFRTGAKLIFKNQTFWSGLNFGMENSKIINFELYAQARVENARVLGNN